MSDVEPDNSSDVDQLRHMSESADSCPAPHLKSSDSKQEMNETCCASNTTQNTGKCHIMITLFFSWLSHI